MAYDRIYAEHWLYGGKAGNISEPEKRTEYEKCTV